MRLRFFSSYGRTEAGWVYYFGDFAAQSLPLNDVVHLSLKIQNGSDIAFAEVTVRHLLPAHCRDTIRF